MKWLSIIFSIYLIALSCLPCADDTAVAIGSAASIGHEPQHCDNHLCPPFCICGCCGIQVYNYVPRISANLRVTVSPEIQNSLPSYKALFISAFSGSIWQPPKLSADI